MLKYVVAFLLIGLAWALVLLLELPMWIAIAVTALSLSVLLALVVLQFIKARRAAKAIEATLRAQAREQFSQSRNDVDASIQAIELSFAKMVDSLKRSKRGQGGVQAIEKLPCYVVMGPPGSGKSSVLENSGLTFGYRSENEESTNYSGGTRTCEWSVSNEALFLDTAGRYVLDENENQEWVALADLLKKNRSDNPLSGVIVTVSPTELGMGQSHRPDEEEIRQQARVIRKRIDEMLAHLEMVVPVFLVFNKVDRVPGFVEFFSDLDRKSREQIWGFTVPKTVLASSPADIFSDNFRELYELAEHRIIRRLKEERRPEDKTRTFVFPQQFQCLEKDLGAFVSELFVPTIYQDAPLLRGVYFTSALQDGHVADKVMQSVTQSLGLRAPVAFHQRGQESETYFLDNLFDRVVIPDAALASRNAAHVKRNHYVQYALTGVLLLLSLGVGLSAGTSFQSNRNLVRDTRKEVSKVAEGQNSGSSLSTAWNDLNTLRERYELLRQHHEEGPPTKFRMGMYKGEKLYSPTAEFLARSTRKTFIEPMLEKESKVMRRFAVRYANPGIPPTDEEFQSYREQLRRYLLLTETGSDPSAKTNPTGAAPSSEPGLDEVQTTWLKKELSQQWTALIAADSGGALPSPESSAQIESLVDSYLTLLRADSKLALPRDHKLVRDVRRVLRRTDRSSAVLAKLVAEVEEEGYGLTLRDMIATPSVQNGNRRIRGAFTKTGWDDYVKSHLEEALKSSPEDKWVLARNEQTADNEEQLAIAQLQSRYFEMYIKEWQEFIGAIYLSGPRDYVQALTILQDLTRGGTPPLGGLMRHIAYNTQLYEEEAEEEEMPLDGADPLSKAARKAKKAKAKADKALGKLKKKKGPSGANLVTMEDVENAFVGLTRFGVAPQAPRTKGAPPPVAQSLPIDVYQEQLIFLRDAVQARIEHPEESKSLQSRLKQARTRVKGIIGEQDVGWRPRFNALLWPPIDGLSKLSASSVVADMSKAWCNEVVTPYQRSLGTQYPFKKKGYDSSIADFTQMFHPDTGLVWSFYRAALASKIPLEGDRFVFAEQGEASKTDFNSALLKFLQRSRDLGTIFFPSGSSTPRFDFDVLIQGTAGVSETAFTVDGVTIKYRNGPEQWQRMHWPAEGTKKGASIRAKGYGVDGHVEQSGEWGFIRLLEQGTVEGKAGRRVFTVKWDLSDQGAGVLTIKIRPSRAETPLFGIPSRGSRFLGLFRDSASRVPLNAIKGTGRCQVG